MKKILILIMALAMVLSMGACNNESDKPEDVNSAIGQNSQKPDDQPDSSVLESDTGVLDKSDDEPGDTSNTSGVQKTDWFYVTDEEAEESTIVLNYKKPVSVAIDFVMALATGQYDVAVYALDTNGSPFVFAEDIAFGLPRSQFSSIIEYAGKEAYLAVDDDKVTKSAENATITVDMMNAKGKPFDSYTLYLSLSEDNRWLVRDNSFYVADYYISVAGNTALTINGVAADDYFVGKTGYNKLKDMYGIPAIGKAKKKLEISCDRYTETFEELPVSNSTKEPLSIGKILGEDKTTAALKAIKNTWNSMYEDYVNGASIAELSKYFDESVDTEVIKTCCDGFQNLINSPSTFTDKDHHITQIQIRDGESCFYITDDVIVVNIQYQLDWVWDWSSGGAESCRRKSHILLKDTDEGYKIFYVSDGALFSDSSGNDW